jgi:hypothetical protein
MAQTTSAWWQRHTRQRAATRAPDPADMGTAFGLEFILDQSPLPASEAASGAPRESTDGWWRRLLARRHKTV